MDIRRQKVLGAPVSPNGMRVKWNNPRRVQKAERSLARSVNPSCQYSDSRSKVAKYLAPLKWSNASWISGRIGVFLGNGVHPSVGNAKPEGIVLLSNEANRRCPTGCRRLYNPVFNISFRISSSASHIANSGFLGAWRKGWAFPVSISCWRIEQKPISVDDVTKVCLWSNNNCFRPYVASTRKSVWSNVSQKTESRVLEGHLQLKSGWYPQHVVLLPGRGPLDHQDQRATSTE